SLSGALELWFDEALKHATATFLKEATASVTDLRSMCRMWAVRSTCHTIFGTAMPDTDMAEGIAQVQVFHRFMFNKNTGALRDAETLEEFQRTRAFLDEAVRVGLAAARTGDRTILASLLEAMPGDIQAEERIDHLRPVLFRILFERLGIDGLSLLWALVHLGQDPDLVEEIAKEALSETGASSLATAVASEIQRLYPELPFFYRTTSQDLNFDTMTIPAQATLLFSPFLLHRDGRCWEQPTRFDPRRFLNGAGHPAHFVPFGIGANARRQADRVIAQSATVLTVICKTSLFGLAAQSRPGDLLPVFRSILAPRGRISLWWKSRAFELVAQRA
ncbi:Cytochrome P450, partial [Rhizobium mongolense subsp. loessense]